MSQAGLDRPRDPETGRVTIDIGPYRAREACERAFDPEGSAYRLQKVQAEVQRDVLRQRNMTRARGPKKASQEKREAIARDRRHRKLLTSR